MASIVIGPSCNNRVYIYQGSNNPLVVLLDMTAAELTAVSISLWRDDSRDSEPPLKAWKMEDIRFDGNAIICPWTSEETAALPEEKLAVEAKGLDDDGNTVFWEEFAVYVMPRRDKNIDLQEQDEMEQQGGD